MVDTHGAGGRSGLFVTDTFESRRSNHMGISVSLLLSAAGAILLWAVDVTANGINLHTVGAILLVVGIIGFVLSLVFWSTWGGFGRADRPAETAVVRERV
jgi:hypothetical protein